MIDKAFDIAPCGYFSFTESGTILQVNETCANWLGYEKDELLNKNIETIFTLPTRIFYQTHFFPLVKMQGHAEEIFLSLLNNERPQIPVLLNAKRNEDPSHIACAFIIVPNRKKFEDELVAARKEAEAALRENTALINAKADLQKNMEQLDTQMQLVSKQNHELSQLNHVVTHSLKEPLRKIMMYTEKLQPHIQENGADSLSRLTRASVHMRNVVAGLQKYIWLNDTPLKFSKIALDDIIAKAAQQVNEHLETPELELKSESLPLIEGDQQQLEILFFQILSNAVKFKKNDIAHVTIKASIIRQNRFRSLENKYQYEDFVRLEITDKGIGFETANAEVVFDLFRKLHFTEGIGLGLALCRKIADNHFGSIKAESRANEGTTITVALPIQQSFHQIPLQ